MCWPSSAKYIPSISTEPPGPAYSAVASWRTTSPPKETATWRRVASRPTIACWVEWCTASSSQSCSGDHGELGAVADDDLDVLRQGRGALEAQHDGGLREGAGADTRWPAEATSLPVPVSGDRGGLLADVLLGDVDQEHRVGGRPGTRADAVGRHEPGAAAGLVVDADALGASRRPPRAPRPRRSAPSSGASWWMPAQPLERREPPDLLAAGGHDVVGDVERPLGVQVAEHLLGVMFERVSHAVGCNSHRFSTSSVLGGRGGFADRSSTSSMQVASRSGCQARSAQPTAPSICSSMSRLSSRAYSIGSSFAIGSTKPRTIIAIASSSCMPRDIR